MNNETQSGAKAAWLGFCHTWGGILAWFVAALVVLSLAWFFLIKPISDGATNFAAMPGKAWNSVTEKVSSIERPKCRVAFICNKPEANDGETVPSEPSSSGEEGDETSSWIPSFFSKKKAEGGTEVEEPEVATENGGVEKAKKFWSFGKEE